MPNNQNDVIQLTMRMRISGADLMQNVWHFRVDDAAGLTDEELLADMQMWMQGVESQMDDLQHTSISYEVGKVYNLTQDRPVGPVAWYSAGGAVAGDPLPSGVAALITFYTGVKRVVGKKFFGGLVETALTAAEWTSATLATLDDIALYFFTPTTIGGHGYTPVIYNRTLKTVAPILLYAIRSVPAYQRRRKPGVGA